MYYWPRKSARSQVFKRRENEQFFKLNWPLPRASVGAFPWILPNPQFNFVPNSTGIGYGWRKGWVD